MSAKVYYHIECDQLLIVWRIYSRSLVQTGTWAHAYLYQELGFACEGPHGTILVGQSFLTQECVEIGPFDEDEP